ncbi:MAG: hypothetical protein R3C56_13215 [Pirellulaceae bacterium]
MDLGVHEEVIVDGVYRRQLISYAVEADGGHTPIRDSAGADWQSGTIVALHGTYEFRSKAPPS